MKKEKTENSILKESLIEFKDIKNMMSKTSDGIVKNIINEKLKDSLRNIITEADDFEEEDIDADVDNTEDTEEGVEDTNTETVDDLESENEPEGDELEGDDAENDFDAEDGEGMESEDDELEGEGEEDFDFDEFKTGEDEYDLTNNSIEDVVKVFKKIDDNDSIIVKKLENGKVELIDNEAGTDYLIDLGEDGDSESDIELEIDEEDFGGEELEGEDMEDDLNEETEIEIELDGAEDMVGEKNMTQSIGTNRRAGRMTQTRKTYAPGVNNRDGSKLIANESVRKVAKVYEDKIKKIEEAYAKRFKSLNEEVSQYKQALTMFRDKLKENAVLNNNLAKYVKLVTENATTKNEKIEILGRFAKEANTIESGNALYESIQKTLNGDSKLDIKIDKQFTVQPQTKRLDEQVIYQSKDLQETIGLINRMNGLGKK